MTLLLSGSTKEIIGPVVRGIHNIQMNYLACALVFDNKHRQTTQYNSKG